MIKMVKTSALLVLGLGLTMVQANEMKKYEVKSGKIVYELKGSGDIMGMVQIKSIGKKRVIFDDYGIKNLEEKSEIKKETTMGETKVKKDHTLVYMNSAILYKVDFKKKRIDRMKNRGAAIAAMFGGGKNLKESGEAMMKKMGGKKLGTDKVLGYTCDVWELMGSKQCMYKGIPLKVETNVMGMKSIEVATKAEFDIDLNKDNFKLPDYPVYAFDMDRMMEGKEPKELDKSKLEDMDKIDNVKAVEESKEASQAMQGMAAGMAALVKAGVDLNADELTPEQEKIMQKAMIGAMGGEGKMLAKMKEEMLGNEKEMEFAKRCFGGADTLKEANTCVDKGNKMFDDDQEHLSSWTKADKNEMLKEMAQYEKMIPCVKSAQTMDTMMTCVPRDMR